MDLSALLDPAFWATTELHRPHALWALLGLPLLWWLSRPPRPRRQIATAHLPQWMTALRGLRRRPTRRANVRFVLLALALILAVLAAADLRIGARAGPRRLVAIVDTSASMDVRDDSGNAASALARRRVESLLASVDDGVEVDVVLAGADVRVLERVAPGEVDPATTTPQRFTRAQLDEVRAEGAGTTEPAAVARALRAEPRTGGSDESVVVLIGDQRPRAVGGEVLPDDDEPSEHVFAERVGSDEALANAALVSCRIRDEWPLDVVEIEVEVARNAAARAGEWSDLELGIAVETVLDPEARDGVPPPRALARTEDPEPVGFAGESSPGAPAIGTALLPLRRAAGGPVRLQLVVRDAVAESAGAEESGRWRLWQDALGRDDSVEVWLPPPPAPDVVLRTEGEPGPFLAAAGELLAGLGAGRVVTARDAPTAGFVLTDGGALAAAPPRSVTFGTRLVPAAGDDTTSRRRPAVLDWDRRHPMMQGLDLSELRVERALPANALPPTVAEGGSAHVLIDGDGGPLAVLAGRGVHLAFRLDDSNLGLLAAFPQWLRRAFVHAYGAAARPRMLGSPLFDVEESALRSPVKPALAESDGDPLAALGRPATRLASALLLAAAALLALRAWLR